MKTLQAAPVASVGPQVVSWEKSVGLAPDRMMSDRVAVVVPVFVMVSTDAGLVVPCRVVGKAREVALKLSTGWALAVPVRATVWAVALAVEEMLRAALSEPVAIGLKDTATVHPAEAARVAPQVFNSRNEVGLVPASVMLWRVTVLVPELVMATDCAALVVPTNPAPNERLVGLSVSPVVAPCPVPLTFSSWGDPVAL